MTNQEIKQSKFAKWMAAQGLSEGTIKMYANGILSNDDVEKTFLRVSGSPSMYDINSVSTLEKVRDAIEELDVDIKGKRRFSCAITKYIDFLEQIR